MGKLRLKKGRILVQDHVAGGWWSYHSLPFNQGEKEVRRWCSTGPQMETNKRYARAIGLLEVTSQ